jgi:hypothetical protein
VFEKLKSDKAVIKVDVPVLNMEFEGTKHFEHGIRTII